MNTINEIESAVEKLPRKDLGLFREWFDEYDARAWDDQFENDVNSGKLDQLAKDALKDFHAGRCKEL